MHDNGQRIPTRSEMDAKYLWNVEDIYESDAAWEQDFERLSERITEAHSFWGTLGNSGESLLAWFRFAEELSVLAGELGNYAFRRHDEDTTRDEYQSMVGRFTAIAAEMATATSWVIPEIHTIEEGRIASFIRETAGLESYAHALDDILRRKAHTLGPNEERILALATEVAESPSEIFSFFNNADIRFGTIQDEQGNEVEVSKGRYLLFQESKDRRVREDSYRALFSEYARWQNTLAATMNAQVKRDIFYARSRNYESSLHAALAEYNIPKVVYDNLVSTIRENLTPLHRAMKIRRKLLAISHVRPWDLYAPLHGETLSISYEDAVAMLKRSLNALGDSYARDMSAAFERGWIDVYENQGKQSGAYSAWTYGTHPYILLNYTSTLKDVFTIAHELGHAMHSYYTWQHQPPVYGDYTIFCAEVASTVNEVLLVDALKREFTTRDQRLQLLLHYVDTIRSTVYNQVLFAEFEQRVHESVEKGGVITAEYLNGEMKDLYATYYGKAFETDDLYDVNWARIPHFYRSFYVYQYATGLSAAVALASQIKEGNDDARERYLQFLSRGNSAYSMSLLNDAGIDMTTPKPVQDTAMLMNSLLDEVEALI